MKTLLFVLCTTAGYMVGSAFFNAAVIGAIVGFAIAVATLLIRATVRAASGSSYRGSGSSRDDDGGWFDFGGFGDGGSCGGGGDGGSCGGD